MMIEKRHQLKDRLFALQASDQSLFEFIHETPVDGLVFCDLHDPTTEWVSSSLLTCLGLTPGSEERHLNHLFEADRRLLMQCRAEEQTDIFMLRYRKTDGVVISFNCRSRIIQQDDETYWLGVYTQREDTTKNSNTNTLYESEVKAERELTDNILNSLPGIFCLCNRQGKFLRWNKNLEKITGYTPDEIERMHPGDFGHQDDRGLMASTIEQVFTTGEATVEVRLTKKSGESVLYYLTGICIEYNNETCMMGLGFDVSRMRQTEQALKESENRYFLAARAGKSAVWEMIPEEGRIVYDENLPVLFGYKPEEFPQDILQWTILMPPEEINTMKQLVLDLAVGNTQTYQADHRILKKDGSTGWVSINGSVVTTPGERPVKMIGITTDITDRKQAETALIENESSLQKAFEIAMIGSWKYNIPEDRYDWTEGAIDVIGWEENDVPNNFKEFLTYVHPDDIQPLKREIIIADNCGIFDFEHRMIIYGQVKWFRLKSHIEYTRDGKPLYSIGIIHDITASREAQLRLEKSEQGLKQAQEIACLGNWELDLQTYKATWSDEAFRILGLDPTLVQPSFEQYLAMIHPDDIAYVTSMIEESSKTKTPSSFTYRIIRPDATIRTVRSESRLILNSQGEMVSVYGIIHDITEQIQVQEQLKDALNFNKTIIETAPLGIWIFDESGKTITANPAIAELSGGDIETLHTLNFRSLESWKKSGLYDAAIEALSSDKPVRKEIHTTTSLNKEIWIEALLTSIQFNGRKHLILMTYDIKDRMLAERALRERETQLSIATETAKLGYWEHDLTTGMLTMNDQFLDVLKTSAEELGGYTIPIDMFTERFLPPDERHIMEEGIREVMEAADPDFRGHLEFQFQNMTGELGYLMASYFVVRDEQGAPIKVIGANQDITARKEAEESMRRLLYTTTEQNKRLKEFSYITSHNIRSSVVNLLGLTDILLNEPYNPDHVRMIKTNTQKLDITIRNINELINFENEINSLAREDCQLSEVIQRVLAQHTQSIKEKGVEIEVDVPNDITVRAIPAYLDSILHNLITNALKYGVTELSKKIDISAHKNGKGITISVKDYGLGIDLKKNRDKLFKLGSRLHMVSHDSQGLGLFMTRRQVEAMGGTIEVESEINAGSTFNVTFNGCEDRTPD